MSFAEYFPIFDKLTRAEQEELSRAAYLRTAPAGTLLHNGSDMCLGLLVIRSGQLRAFITSDEGREITINRFFEMDICVFFLFRAISDAMDILTHFCTHFCCCLLFVGFFFVVDLFDVMLVVYWVL